MLATSGTVISGKPRPATPLTVAAPKTMRPMAIRTGVESAASSMRANPFTRQRRVPATDMPPSLALPAWPREHGHVDDDPWGRELHRSLLEGLPDLLRGAQRPGLAFLFPGDEHHAPQRR